MVLRMIELIRITDPVTLQITCDVLEEKNIVFSVENGGMNALMPVPGLMFARLLVGEKDESAARQIISDLQLL